MAEKIRGRMTGAATDGLAQPQTNDSKEVTGNITTNLFLYFAVR